MAIARSRITAQGQISIPAEVRRRLGVGPGSVVEWNDQGKVITISRVGKYSFQNIREHLFPDPPLKANLEDLKEGVRKHLRKKYAKR